MTWERRSPNVAERSSYRGLARVQETPCYDFLISLGALYNPRLFEATRSWARAARTALARGEQERGRFFFQGDQGLGYGAARLVADLPDGAAPEALIAAVRSVEPRTLVLYMVDTGETSDETLDAFRRFLEAPGDCRALDRALRGLTPDWAQRCRRVLSDPVGTRAEFADLLDHYLAVVFAGELAHLREPLAQAAITARELLRVLPPTEAIERLTGGYTLAPDLPLSRIIVAPSVFI